MSGPWSRVAANDVRVGDRVRLDNGAELLVSSIEPNFLGMDAMVAFIEDTPERWLKQPVAVAAELEVQRA